jgi:hypothetical protein
MDTKVKITKFSGRQEDYFDWKREFLCAMHIKKLRKYFIDEGKAKKGEKET